MSGMCRLAQLSMIVMAEALLQYGQAPLSIAYACAVSSDFIYMDGNAHAHRSNVPEVEGIDHITSQIYPWLPLTLSMFGTALESHFSQACSANNKLAAQRSTDREMGSNPSVDDSWIDWQHEVPLSGSHQCLWTTYLLLNTKVDIQFHLNINFVSRYVPLECPVFYLTSSLHALGFSNLLLLMFSL